MISDKPFYMDTHRIIIVISYITVFVIGLYIARSTPYIHIFRSYDENCTTFTASINKSSANVSNKLSFFDLGMKYQTDKVTFHHYDKMYEKYLQKYVGSDVSLLEIGLGCGMGYGPGASAYLWRSYLGPRANIHLLEFDRNCGEAWYKTHGGKLNVTMHYGSQDDVAFLSTVNTEQGYFDIIVDDGGHSMKQQITSFTHLLPKVRSGGVYVIEDLQTSYFTGADSGYLVNSTTIELIKRLVDDIHVDSPKKSTQLGDNQSNNPFIANTLEQPQYYTDMEGIQAIEKNTSTIRIWLTYVSGTSCKKLKATVSSKILRNLQHKRS